LGVGGHESPESIDASGSRPNLGLYSRMIPNFVTPIQRGRQIACPPSRGRLMVLEKPAGAPARHCSRHERGAYTVCARVSSCTC